MDLNFVANVESAWMHELRLANSGRVIFKLRKISETLYILNKCNLQPWFCFVDNLNLLLLS